MKVQEMQEYLKQFNPEDEIGLLAVDTKRRKVLNPFQVIVVTDVKIPVIGLDVNGERDMDEDEIKVMKKCEVEQ